MKNAVPRVRRGPTEFYLSLRNRPVPMQSVAINSVLLVLGLALILQPRRWTLTPAYGILLQIAPPWIWGIIYLVSGVLLLTSIVFVKGRQPMIMIAHTLVIVLLAVWEFAFVTRYLTDGATTIVNVVSWGCYLFLAIRSALLTEHPQFFVAPDRQTS